MKKIKLILIGALFSILALGMAGVARAEIKISADFENDPLFDVENAYPGYSKTKEAEVENVGTEAQDLYLDIENATNDDFADKIKFYLKDKSSGNYLIGGAGDRFTLKEINDAGNVFVERLEPGGSNRYEMKVKLDESAGNEFQAETTKFDITFGFTGEPITPGAPLPLRPGQAAGGTEEGVLESTAGAVQGTEEEVAGAQMVCSEWPLWVWILILIIYAVGFNYVSFYNYKERKKVRWFWQIVLTTAAYLLWLYFDECDLYWWFPYALIIAGLASYWYYLHRLRKIIGENQGQIKTG